MQSCTRKIVAIIIFILTIFDFHTRQKVKPAKATKIVVVDLVEVKKQSTVLQQVHKDSVAMFDKYQKIISNVEEELKADKEKIEKIEDDEEYKKAVSQFEERYNKFKRFVQKIRYSLDEALKSAEDDWEKAFLVVVKGLAEKNVYDLVLLKDEVSFCRESLDITKKVIDTINSTNLQVKLKEVDDAGHEVF